MSSASKSVANQSGYLISSILIVGALTLLLVVLLTQTDPVQSSSHLISSVPDPAAVKAGRTIFLTVCAACHGAKATGIKGLGKPLIGSVFFNNRTNAELLKFVQTGRPITDPLNTSGVMMPPRGGRPSLTDNDLQNVIAYIRSLNARTNANNG